MSGKSFFGKKLSEFLQWRFIDTDIVLEQLYKDEKGKKGSCSDIFKLEGESYFRNLERKAIESLKDSTKTIIAIGGGALNTPENITALKKLGKLIFLDCDLDTLIERIKQKEKIPSYLDEQNPAEGFKALAKTRIPVFQKHCDAIVATQGLNEMEIMAKICSNFL